MPKQKRCNQIVLLSGRGRIMPVMHRPPIIFHPLPPLLWYYLQQELKRTYSRPPNRTLFPYSLHSHYIKQHASTSAHVDRALSCRTPSPGAAPARLAALDAGSSAPPCVAPDKPFTRPSPSMAPDLSPWLPVLRRYRFEPRNDGNGWYDWSPEFPWEGGGVTHRSVGGGCIGWFRFEVARGKARTSGARTCSSGRRCQAGQDVPFWLVRKLGERLGLWIRSPLETRLLFPA